ncbi:phospholipase A2 inhibitor and Ly6/PLAUR domain-containing protein-like, partial [Python bivittatus]|uniref:Phospholipase A2 inhibitor and Ly6/PLAUR domain-containing protein-like n=1 Tax=Python bivittatus TaxID=176946 RepID=A0A9F5MWZ2_PYTBI
LKEVRRGDAILYVLRSVFLSLSSVATLECEVCSDIGTNCTGNMKTCDDQQNTCFIILILSTLEDTVMQTVAKGCESKEVCKTPKSHLNMGQGKILQASLICCTKDACKTARPQLPPLKTEVNRKHCPACYSGSGTCDEEMLNCTGPEKYCFHMFSRTYAGKSHFPCEGACEFHLAAGWHLTHPSPAAGN